MKSLPNNRVLETLRSGKIVFSCSLTPVCDPKIAELIGLVGFDCLWIDMEHQDFDYQSVFNACLACRATGMEPMVRIRREGRHSCFRGFEVGGTGIMVPHCMGEVDAKTIVKEARFSPMGLRGMDGVEVSARYGMTPMEEYIEWANRETFIVVQIEDREAVDEIDSIAAVEGIDILFIGPGDLSQSYGRPGQWDCPEIQRAFEQVAQAAKEHGKYWGAPGGNPERARTLIEMGARFLNTTSLSGIMRKGFQDAFESFDAVRREFG